MNRGLIVALLLAVAACGDDGAAATGASECPAVGQVDDVVQWTTADGCAVAIAAVHSHAGPSECGWELVDVLVIEGRTYHWDPVNLLAYLDGQTRNRTLRLADLPPGAVDSGLRRGTEELWEDADDPTYAYVVTGERADRYLLDAGGVIACDQRGSRPE